MESSACAILENASAKTEKQKKLLIVNLEPGIIDRMKFIA